MKAALSASEAAIEGAYAAWIRQYDTLTARDHAAIAADIPRLARQPTFDVLLPIGLAVGDRLLDTVNSLRTQLYPYWELRLAGAPQSPGALAALADADPRIRLVDASRHVEPATAAASALRGACGDYVALLSEGDRLPPHALYELADTLVRFPDTALLYSDEDLIDFTGARSMPRFKSGWDPDLLLGCDYIGGIAVFDRRAIQDGDIRAKHGLAFGYDLVLRVANRIEPDRIRHVPSVLLHRPADSPQTLRDRALGRQANGVREAAGDFVGPRAEILQSPLLPACHRVVWALPSPPSVSVIMPTRDHADLFVPAAWGVLLRTDYPDLELIIVDNGSQEDLTRIALRDLRADPRVRIVPYAGEFNFAAINNRAVAVARGEVLVLLNNDVDVIHLDWLRELASHAIRPDVGAVGAKLLYADGHIQHGGIAMTPGPTAAHAYRLADRFDPGYCGALASARSCSAVTAACLAIRRAVYLEVGGLDETNFAVAFNDVDLCLRLGEFGYRVVWTPFAELFHLESKSRGRADTEAKAARERREIDLLKRLWHHSFDDDPYVSPNLECAWEVPLHLCKPRRRRPWQRGAT